MRGQKRWHMAAAFLGFLLVQKVMAQETPSFSPQKEQIPAVVAPEAVAPSPASAGDDAAPPPLLPEAGGGESALYSDIMRGQKQKPLLPDANFLRRAWQVPKEPGLIPPDDVRLSPLFGNTSQGSSASSPLDKQEKNDRPGEESSFGMKFSMPF